VRPNLLTASETNVAFPAGGPTDVPDTASRHALEVHLPGGLGVLKKQMERSRFVSPAIASETR
jgi:hypothetical protein